ncbi:MAG: hypothetical protein CRN43_01915 [Candidatus Nephrothrix sp. EaCA]|nr:MAG: hypothetical protein CRN43_01915 [Candidatus Nephrothrix sp. EaCA]
MRSFFRGAAPEEFFAPNQNSVEKRAVNKSLSAPSISQQGLRRKLHQNCVYILIKNSKNHVLYLI